MTSVRSIPASARALAAILLVGGGLAALIPASAPASGSGPAVPARPSLPQIERDFMCPVCGVPLAVAESPQADRERAYITDLYRQGETEAQIKQAMVAQFGSSVLVLPPHGGFDLSAYLAPLIALAVLVGGLAVLVVRWRRPAGPAVPSRPPSLSAIEARRLEEDLARWDR